ncbi:hypothetical protein ACB098_11G196400 [Castanea mollissima]
MSVMVSYTMADAAKDREECAQQLVGLATCLPYVGGQAKAPTPDCCTGLKQVLKDNKNCLCVIVRDRNDPKLGQQINVTLTLACLQFAMPLLKSPTQVFYQLGRSSNQSDGSPAPSPSGNVTNIHKCREFHSAKSEGTIGQDKNEGYYDQMREFGMEIVIGGALTWCFIGSHLFI